LANQLDQLFQIDLCLRLNALKVWRSIVAIHEDAIQEQDMEMYIEVSDRSEALYQCHCAGGAILQWQSSLVDQEGRNSSVNNAQHLAHRFRVGGEKASAS
jgi:hypothetical protein